VSPPSKSTLGLLADVVSMSWVDGPGNRFVVFTQGCTFDCIACHNPSTIARCAPSSAPRRATVRELLAELKQVAPFLSGVTVSGGECTLQPKLLRALLWWIKADPALSHLTTLVDTNGDAPTTTWDSLRRVMDGAAVDLKALDPAVHRVLTGHGNERVLASLRHLRAIDRLHEVRLLLVPGFNDDAGQLDATGRWLHDLDPDVQVRLIGFRPHGVRPAFRSLPASTADELAAGAEVLAGAGLRSVTVG